LVAFCRRNGGGCEVILNKIIHITEIKCMDMICEVENSKSIIFRMLLKCSRQNFRASMTYASYCHQRFLQVVSTL